MRTLTITRTKPRILPDPGVGNRWGRVLTTPEYCRSKGLPIQNILDFTDVEQSVPSIPDVFQRTISNDEKNPTTLTLPLQDWIYDRFHECAPRSLPEIEMFKCWLNTFGSAVAFCNGTGVDKVNEATGEFLYADFIGGTGLDKTGIKLWATICRNALVKVLDESYWGGEMRVQIEAMDALDPVTLTKTYKGNEHLFFYATSWNRMWLNGVPGTHDPRWPWGRGNPFPHFGDDRTTGVPIPILSTGTKVSYLPREWVVYLKPGDPFPNPYWDGFQ